MPSYLFKGWGGKDLRGNKIPDKENIQMFFDSIKIKNKVTIELDYVNDRIIIKTNNL